MLENGDSRIDDLRSDLSLFKWVSVAFLSVVTLSTILFHVVEKWSWLDSFYFTIVTISTVGYGNLVPVSAFGKVANILLIILGIGIFTVFVTQLVKRQGLRRLEKREKTKR